MSVPTCPLDGNGPLQYNTASFILGILQVDRQTGQDNQTEEKYSAYK
jgi:hypothetical protein